ncbi:MAG: adenylosuccinate synthase, partial [Bacteroidetes bacterium]
SLDIEPVYETLKGWNRELEIVEHYTDLPVELTDYVSFIEKNVGVPVKIVSLGPDRKETVFK